MAAKTPVTKGTAGWIDAVGSTYDSVLDAVVPNTDPTRRTYYFDGNTGNARDIDDADTWTPAGRTLTGVTSCHVLTTTGTDAISVTFSGGVFTFQTDGADKAGYLVFHVKN